MLDFDLPYIMHIFLKESENLPSSSFSYSFVVGGETQETKISSKPGQTICRRLRKLSTQLFSFNGPKPYPQAASGRKVPYSPAVKQPMFSFTFAKVS